MLTPRPVPNPLVLVPNGCETEMASAEVTTMEMGMSWNARVEELVGGTSFKEGMELMPFTDEEGTELEMLPGAARKRRPDAFLQLARRHERVRPEPHACWQHCQSPATSRTEMVGRDVAVVLSWAWFGLDGPLV